MGGTSGEGRRSERSVTAGGTKRDRGRKMRRRSIDGSRCRSRGELLLVVGVKAKGGKIGRSDAVGRKIPLGEWDLTASSKGRRAAARAGKGRRRRERGASEASKRLGEA